MGPYVWYANFKIRQKGASSMYYDIIWVQGHIEVYDNAGRFCFSADSEGEALAELGESA